MKKIVTTSLALLTLASGAFTLTACGSEPAATIDETYVVSESQTNAYNGNDYSVYQLNLLSNGRYEFIKTTYTEGFSMNLGTYSVETFGTFTKGQSEDGYTACTLSRSDHAIVNAYSLAGGFNIQIDTATATYPAELPAETQGEKTYANSSDDVFDRYGAETTVYLNDSNNTFSLTNPNA